MSDSLVELDGSFGEGGGQILRSSLALSLLTGRPFHLRHIRARRSRPGLQPQHLMSVRAAARISEASVRGGTLHSTDLVFKPGAVQPGSYHFAIGTAGATGLVLHTLYLPLILATVTPSDLTLEGGTHVSTSPCFHFLDLTWRPYMALLGLEIAMHLRQPGFYPRGGGIVEVHVQPCPRLRGIQLLQRSPVTRATVLSAAAGLPQHIIDRQAQQAGWRLQGTGLQVDIRQETWNGGPGTMLAVVLDTAPVPTLFFGLGARGKRAEQVADEAVDQVLAYLGATPAAVDVHSADQIVLPLALAEGPSAFSVAEVTPHLLTNSTIIGRFIDREIVCQGEKGGPGIVQIT